MYPEINPIPRNCQLHQRCYPMGSYSVCSSTHLQKYAETDGSIAYLQNNTINQLIRISKYMILHIKNERPADQKCNALYYILDDQWSMQDGIS